MNNCKLYLQERFMINTNHTQHVFPTKVLLKLALVSEKQGITILGRHWQAVVWHSIKIETMGGEPGVDCNQHCYLSIFIYFHTILPLVCALICYLFESTERHYRNTAQPHELIPITFKHAQYGKIRSGILE